MAPTAHPHPTPETQMAKRRMAHEAPADQADAAAEVAVDPKRMAEADRAAQVDAEVG